MKKEVDRCIDVLELAKEGNIVSLISSGDSGVYGMAGIMLEIADEDIEIEVSESLTTLTVTSPAIVLSSTDVARNFGSCHDAS